MSLKVVEITKASWSDTGIRVSAHTFSDDQFKQLPNSLDIVGADSFVSIMNLPSVKLDRLDEVFQRSDTEYFIMSLHRSIPQLLNMLETHINDKRSQALANFNKKDKALAQVADTIQIRKTQGE